MPCESHPIGKLVDRDNVPRQIQHEFVSADSSYVKRRKGLWKWLTPLAVEVDTLLEQGRTVDCSQQHRLEAQWLLNYTADWDRAETTLKCLEDSLRNHNQAPLSQDPDGSWAIAAQNSIENSSQRSAHCRIPIWEPALLCIHSHSCRD
jgi:hypothetical protein